MFTYLKIGIDGYKLLKYSLLIVVPEIICIYYNVNNNKNKNNTKTKNNKNQN